MSYIQVFGIGSPFGDDQIGWKVVEHLIQNKTLQTYIPTKLQLEILDRPGISLLTRLNRDATIFLIDAIKSGAEVGKLHRYTNLHINSAAIGFSTHGLGIIQALELGAVLGELPKHIIIYGIEIGEIVLQTTFSQTIQKAVQDLTEIISNDIQKLLIT